MDKKIGSSQTRGKRIVSSRAIRGIRDQLDAWDGTRSDRTLLACPNGDSGAKTR